MGQEKECRKPTHRKHLSLHDYHERCIYHITLVVSDRVPLLGTIGGSTADDARVVLSPLGRMVRQAIQDIPIHEWKKGNDVQILAAVTMPEHIHFVLFVRQRMKDKVGMVIRGFKQGCNKALRLWLTNAGLMEPAGYGDICGLEKSLIPNGEITSIAGNNTNNAAGNNANNAAGNNANNAADNNANNAADNNANHAAGNNANNAADNNANHAAGNNANNAAGNNANGDIHGVAPLLESSPLEARSNLCSNNHATNNHTTSTHTSTHAIEVIPLDPAGEAFVRQLRSIRSERILQEHALFEADFDETRLQRKGQLSAMIRYVHNNPSHRWLKRHKPQWLKPMRGIVIGGRSYDAIGNINLLGLSRCQVFVRSRWTDEQRRNYKNLCVVKARSGYALVSPFISPHEAEVRDFCLKEGHSAIVLSDNGFTDFTQCPGGLYDYCVNGQVLILVASNTPYIERKPAITRNECMQLNTMATEICTEHITD